MSIVLVGIVYAAPALRGGVFEQPTRRPVLILLVSNGAQEIPVGGRRVFHALGFSVRQEV
ncbi:hypothetical protein [Sphingobium scionense]|uniref:Uncharacterized protein n=1 Tax=Sphingobium scionense TaxID=1404341 RepID=A0A7W6PW87_9SPHN|nr:hypothetical protein [Sphingobium scionense]